MSQPGVAGAPTLPGPGGPLPSDGELPGVRDWSPAPEGNWLSGRRLSAQPELILGVRGSAGSLPCHPRGVLSGVSRPSPREPAQVPKVLPSSHEPLRCLQDLPTSSPQAPTRSLAAPDSWCPGGRGEALQAPGGSGRCASRPEWATWRSPQSLVQEPSPAAGRRADGASVPSSAPGPQPAGCARASLARAPSPPHPHPGIIPLSSTVLAPARCLSTDLSPRNPCPALPVSSHPALSPSSPHRTHLPPGHGAHHALQSPGPCGEPARGNK